jgi:hypothetical protein
MESELYQKLHSILCNYPTIYQLLGGDFFRRQCKAELTSCILKHLAQEGHNENLPHLSYMESQLAQLSCFPGFNKLQKGLRSPNGDEYYETQIQIERSVWFAQQHLLKEIEPELHDQGESCDMLLAFKGQHIYCEVTSRRFAGVNSKITTAQMQRLQKKQPWLTEQDIEYQYEINNVLRSLKDKAQHQLPPTAPGILVLETGRAMFFHWQTKELANKLFASTSRATTPHVILIMLWSGDSGSQMGEAPFWFVNRNSYFKAIGRALLKYLGQEQKAVECG